MPKSPWFLVREGRYDEAEKTHAKDLVAFMIHTNAIEEGISQGTSY